MRKHFGFYSIIMDNGNRLFADFVKCLTIMLACQSSEALEAKSTDLSLSFLQSS